MTTAVANTNELAVHLPRPMVHQAPALVADFRFKNLKCGRRWGKTKLGLIACLEGHGPWINDPITGVRRRKYKGAIHGGHLIWIAPTYTVANREIWPELKNATWEAGEKSEELMEITLPGGGFVRVASAERPETLRSAGYDGVVFDEDADIPQNVWTTIMRPALADRRGWAIFIGTPKGYNDGYTRWQLAKDDPRWLTLQRPTWDNPIIDDEEIRDLVKDMTMTDIAQEIQAQFVAAGGNLVKESWWRWYSEFPLDDPFVHFGQFVDSAWKIGSKNDYSVIATWGRTLANRFYLTHLWRDRVDFPTLLYNIHAQNQRAREDLGLNFLPVTIEDASSGIGAIQVLRNPTMWNKLFSDSGGDGGLALLPSLPVLPWPDRDNSIPELSRLRGPNQKAARFSPLTKLIQGGQVFLPGTAMIEDGKLVFGDDVEKVVRDFVDEHTVFGYNEWGKPLHAHDDFVDTTTMALWSLSSKPKEEPRTIPLIRSVTWENQYGGVYGGRQKVRKKRKQDRVFSGRTIIIST